MFRFSGFSFRGDGLVLGCSGFGILASKLFPGFRLTWGGYVVLGGLGLLWGFAVRLFVCLRVFGFCRFRRDWFCDFL